MDQFQAFFSMGGYAAFVWPSYALGTLGLIGVWYMYRRTLKTRQAELDVLRPPRTESERSGAAGSSVKEPQAGEA